MHNSFLCALLSVPSLLLAAQRKSGLVKTITRVGDQSCNGLLKLFGEKIELQTGR